MISYIVEKTGQSFGLVIHKPVCIIMLVKGCSFSQFDIFAHCVEAITFLQDHTPSHKARHC